MQSFDQLRVPFMILAMPNATAPDKGIFCCKRRTGPLGP